jgi:hypothetical protein
MHLTKTFLNITARPHALLLQTLAAAAAAAVHLLDSSEHSQHMQHKA